MISLRLSTGGLESQAPAQVAGQSAGHIIGHVVKQTVKQKVGRVVWQRIDRNSRNIEWQPIMEVVGSMAYGPASREVERINMDSA